MNAPHSLIFPASSSDKALFLHFMHNEQMAFSKTSVFLAAADCVPTDVQNNVKEPPQHQL